MVKFKDLLEGIAQHLYHETYWCPSSNPGKSYCTYPGYWFCGYWGCETIVTGDKWEPVKKDEFLEVKNWPDDCKPPIFDTEEMYGDEFIEEGDCTSLNITVLQPRDRGWAIGRMWSVFIYLWTKDLGTVVQVVRTLPQTPAVVGPNKALKQAKSRKETTAESPTSIIFVSPSPTHLIHSQDKRGPAPHDLLYHMRDAAFQSLNASEPDLTSSCWLCYDTNPPFYEGVALDAPNTYSNDTSPTQCRWDTP